MVEATTGWLETYPVPHATAWNTILGLEKQVLWRHGTPERIESDNRTHFRNNLIDTWAKERGIEWVYHIPYHAPASRKIEREIRESPPPERIADVEYASLKSENEVWKASLTFEKEKGEKLGTRVDALMIESQSLKTENRELKMLLASVERREKQLQEKLNLLLNQMPSSVSAKQIRKLIHCADPETWDGDIWYDNDELVEDFDLTAEPVPI
ncbi:insertion element IS476 uncharacterized 39.2 kDa protein-like [Grus japonensis]|uniref:Insertion element IS476 uncharacterized 39.2 kDa protein-like n=1 Tax=Grus japonensis TaxID=30415 RepID=A0ABC9YH70_GRUJA